MVEHEVQISFKDQLILRIIHEQIAIYGMPPTNREILQELKMAKLELSDDILELVEIGSNSTSIVNHSLNNLQKAGFIEKAHYKNHGIKVLKESILPPIIRYSEDKK